ncbi:MAG: C-terminal binding protein [Rhodothermales bacterium]|nr:C-terminal binding protein [Rhodothermales bacterium]
MSFHVVYTDHGFPESDVERSIIEAAGGTLEVIQARTEDDIIEQAASADGLLVQWAPITRKVLESLPNCKIVVRLGIGVDNVDVSAASDHGVRVCNVPDYCIDEVADHAMALALALARQLIPVDRRVRNGNWAIIPPAPLPSFSSMTFGLAGFGRIARGVARRARAFGFRVSGYDPFANEVDFKNRGVERVSLEDLLIGSDILSLHCPLTDETRHMIDESVLFKMKSNAIVINTARGGLIDLKALAAALKTGQISSAGLDVFETEPLGADHPICKCDSAILTSHISWFSNSSIPELQRKAAEEIVRGLLGDPLVSPLN